MHRLILLWLLMHHSLLKNSLLKQVVGKQKTRENYSFFKHLKKKIRKARRLGKFIVCMQFNKTGSYAVLSVYHGAESCNFNQSENKVTDWLKLQFYQIMLQLWTIEVASFQPRAVTAILCGAACASSHNRHGHKASILCAGSVSSAL